MTRTTSKITYKQIKEDGTTVRQSEYIKSFIYSIPHNDKDFGITLKEIARQSGLEINAVSGRVNELKKDGHVEECQKRRCRITGRLVTPVTYVIY